MATFDATTAHDAAQVFAEGDAPHEKTEEGIKVFAGNLAFTTTNEGLRAFFAPVANDIITTAIVQRYSRSAGYGFVTVKTVEAANKAVAELDKKEIDGRNVIVEVAKPKDDRKERQAKRKVSRRGSKAVQGEVTEAEADGHAARIDDTGVEGEAKAAKPKKKKYPRKKKAKAPAVEGDAPPEDRPAVNDTVTTEPKPKERAPRRPRAPREHRPRREPGEQPAGEPSKSVLFVANLAFTVDEAQLTEFFTNAGVSVKTARVVRRRWGTPRKSKGYGFVDVGDEAEQQKAISLTDGHTIADREISVKVAVDAKHIDDAVNKAEGAENPDYPAGPNTAQFPVVPVAA